MCLFRVYGYTDTEGKLQNISHFYVMIKITSHDFLVSSTISDCES